eukprot:m.7435 g.7435  ORF g.7435 m.7435 type:complete len:301 (-) comp5248_c0_seq1:57-959(-)
MGLLGLTERFLFAAVVSSLVTLSLVHRTAALSPCAAGPISKVTNGLAPEVQIPNISVCRQRCLDAVAVQFPLDGLHSCLQGCSLAAVQQEGFCGCQCNQLEGRVDVLACNIGCTLAIQKTLVVAANVDSILLVPFQGQQCQDHDAAVADYFEGQLGERVTCITLASHGQCHLHEFLSRACPVSCGTCRNTQPDDRQTPEVDQDTRNAAQDTAAPSFVQPGIGAIAAAVAFVVFALAVLFLTWQRRSATISIAPTAQHNDKERKIDDGFDSIILQPHLAFSSSTSTQDDEQVYNNLSATQV